MSAPKSTESITHLLMGAAVVLGLTIGTGAEPDRDKSSYTLVNPVPRELMRDMDTDRPDKTESPYTVDAGHYQIESDIVTYTHDRDTSGGANSRVHAWSFAAVNLKAGLCNNVDLQLMLSPINYVRTEDGLNHTTSRQSGFGDVVIRMKWNAWGNDGGITAFGLMPFVKLPSNQDQLGNHEVEGGLILPLSVELPGGWGMGAMTEFDWNRSNSSSGYETEFINTITFSHDLTEKLGGYVEIFTAVSTERNSRTAVTFDMGLDYQLTADIKFDAGVNIGLTDSADDLNPFLGITLRF